MRTIPEIKDTTLRSEIEKARRKPGYRSEIYEAPNKLLARTGPRGVVFYLYRRPQPDKPPTRTRLGVYAPEHPEVNKDGSDFLSLSGARTRALRWAGLQGQAKDPKAEDRAQQLAKAQETPKTFAAAIERYLREQVIGPDPARPRQRKGPEVAHELKSEFVEDKKVPREGQGGSVTEVTRVGLGAKLITNITVDDIMTVIRDAVFRSELRLKTLPEQFRPERAPARHAHNLLTSIKLFFAWAAPLYGLEAAPTDRLRPKKHIGKKVPRKRTLSPTEVRAVWWAAGRLKPWYCGFFRMALVTMQRKSEIGDAPVGEFDLEAALWTIPGKRMKQTEGEPRENHQVPLSALALEVLRDTIPRDALGPYAFSATAGKSPLDNFGRAKVELDRHVLDVLREIAVEQGKDPESVELPPWQGHDLRRTGRTLAAELEVADGIPVSDHVLEGILAHVKKGDQQSYNHATFLKFKRLALDLWAAKLREIIGTPPGRHTTKVVNLTP